MRPVCNCRGYVFEGLFEARSEIVEPAPVRFAINLDMDERFRAEARVRAGRRRDVRNLACAAALEAKHGVDSDMVCELEFVDHHRERVDEIGARAQHRSARVALAVVNAPEELPDGGMVLRLLHRIGDDAREDHRLGPDTPDGANHRVARARSRMDLPPFCAIDAVLGEVPRNPTRRCPRHGPCVRDARGNERTEDARAVDRGRERPE